MASLPCLKEYEPSETQVPWFAAAFWSIVLSTVPVAWVSVYFAVVAAPVTFGNFTYAAYVPSLGMFSVHVKASVPVPAVWVSWL
ncbi:hypothetical protein SAMN02787118_10690 [Streptomyces mirabilis]|uniref:Uncharacterized protein n=1 Tax=Streptomyces mirabilis TaxID=68239 RepID=A0A1I2IDE5_9ACTN|nr:hypothetical protein SAMN02787118_10690 [Streptomyces mirabilis]